MKRDSRKQKSDPAPVDYSRFSDLNKGRNDFSDREMHKATCGDCGKACNVPFKPKEGRPIYCRDCFSKHKPKKF